MWEEIRVSHRKVQAWDLGPYCGEATVLTSEPPRWQKCMNTKTVCIQNQNISQEDFKNDWQVSKCTVSPQCQFYVPKESVEMSCAWGMRHMLCTAGGTPGGLSLPYAQHGICPIQMRHLQREQIHLGAQDPSRLTIHRYHGCLVHFPFSISRCQLC